MSRKILLANDGSEGAARALAFALDLAKLEQAELHMVCVEETQWMPGNREEVIGEQEVANHRFEGVIGRAKEEARKSQVKLETHLLVGHPVKAITAFLKERAFDTLIIGYVGHSQIYGMLIGSTADRLVRLAPCTVMVVK
jgi:nucleotide-binding universal stress UspA family protein